MARLLGADHRCISSLQYLSLDIPSLMYFSLWHYTNDLLEQALLNNQATVHYGNSENAAYSVKSCDTFTGMVIYSNSNVSNSNH